MRSGVQFSGAARGSNLRRRFQLSLKALLIDLERVDAAAVVLIGPGAELALRDARLATSFRYGDLTFEDFEDDRRLALCGPALELLGFRVPAWPAGMTFSSDTFISLRRCPAPDGDRLCQKGYAAILESCDSRRS
jgi:hypothetical protein